jgi:tRNA(fMet)-specific endonuclease VapC
LGLILDTSALIEVERGRIAIDALLSAPGADAFAVAAITLSELWQGAHRTSRPEHRIRRAAFAGAVASRLPVLPFGAEEARCHAELWADLAARGAMIGLHDLLIAATALTGGHAVVTLDARDFSRVPGLRVLDAAAL